MARAEELAVNTVAEFRSTIDGFQTTIQFDLKKWRQKMVDLEAKYESVALWIKAFA